MMNTRLNSNDNSEYNYLSREEKLKMMFEQQKHILDCFLERGAISQIDYDKSLNGLKERMKFR